MLLGDFMNVKSLAIQQFAKFIIGGVFFDRVIDIVRSYMNADLTGDQKRIAALKDLSDIGTGLGTCLLNLGIELAVLFLKEKGIKV